MLGKVVLLYPFVSTNIASYGVYPVSSHNSMKGIILKFLLDKSEDIQQVLSTIHINFLRVV